MQYINRLPLLFALFAAIISGAIGLSRSATNDRILVQMMICMVIFYAIGIYARYTLTEIYEQVKKKKAKIMHAEETKETKEIKEAKHEVKQTGETGNSIAEEEFEPLKVSRFIREKLEQPVEK
ncbi:MAG: hypothetical protein GXZ01_05435 [Clostridiaceae bacterium]|nr:hypothetical protein [Clostridiaceae bacterium]